MELQTYTPWKLETNIFGAMCA